MGTIHGVRHVGFIGEVYIEIPFSVFKGTREVAIGQYRFTRDVFHELIRYVWQGGYPRWKDEIRPDYVVGMKDKIRQAGGNLLFKDLVLGRSHPK
jgi:hypothetical protein